SRLGGRVCLRGVLHLLRHLLQGILCSCCLTASGRTGLLRLTWLLALLILLLTLLTLLAAGHLAGQLCHFLAQLLLFPLQALQLTSALFLVHLLHAPGKITLGTGQSFLTSRQFFQLVGLLGVAGRATTAALRGFVAV